MKKTAMKKLTLDRQTLRNLERELATVAGAMCISGRCVSGTCPTVRSLNGLNCESIYPEWCL